MAVVSGQIKDANVNGKPRDLSKLIFDVSPTDTPFLTMCGRTTASQTLHEWQTDALTAPGANAQKEGIDVTTFAGSNTTELSNKTQILMKAVSVSGTAQAVVQNGVSGQYTHQMALRMKEIKKDLEFALLSNQLSAGESTSGRVMRGLPCWLTTNFAGGASGTAATSSSACTAGTARVPTEALLKALLTSIYNSGGNPKTIMMAPDIRVKMSEVLTGGSTKMEKAEMKKATAVIDVYVSDFGALKLVPNRVQAYVTYSKGCAFVLDPEYWKVAFLRPFQAQKLANTGDSEKGFIVAEATLEARNEASSGVLADLKAA